MRSVSSCSCQLPAHPKIVCSEDAFSFKGHNTSLNPPHNPISFLVVYFGSLYLRCLHLLECPVPPVLCLPSVSTRRGQPYSSAKRALRTGTRWSLHNEVAWHCHPSHRRRHHNEMVSSQ